MRKLIYIFIASTVFFASCSDSESGDAASISPSTDFNGEAPGGNGGSLARFTIMNNHLYAVNWNTLNTFDISTPANPEYLSNTQIGDGIETIWPRTVDNVLFIGSQTGMHIYDAEDPTNLERLSVYEHVFACDPVVANMKHAFVTLNSDWNFGCNRWTNELQIVNIENLRSPYLEVSYEMEQPKGLGLDDSVLYLCDNNFKVYDVSDINNIELMAPPFNIAATDVIPSRGTFNVLFVIGDNGLNQYQLRDGNLELLSTINLGN